jgi:hypothetical protein
MPCWRGRGSTSQGRSVRPRRRPLAPGRKANRWQGLWPTLSARMRPNAAPVSRRRSSKSRRILPVPGAPMRPHDPTRHERHTPLRLDHTDWLHHRLLIAAQKPIWPVFGPPLPVPEPCPGT